MRKSGLVTTVLLLLVGVAWPLAAQLPTRYGTTDFSARAADSESSRTLFTVPAGATLQLEKCRAEWCRIIYQGRAGWTLARHLTASKPVQPQVTPPEAIAVPPPPAPTPEPRLALSLTADQRSEIGTIGRKLAVGQTFEAVREWWESFIGSWGDPHMTDSEVQTLVQAVVREASRETDKDLQFYADKFKYFNELEKLIRTELDRARPQLPSELTTPEEHEAYIGELEQELVRARRNAQLANTEMLERRRRRTQTLQTISNVAKMMHDTAMAVIRKIG